MPCPTITKGAWKPFPFVPALLQGTAYNRRLMQLIRVIVLCFNQSAVRQKPHRTLDKLSTSDRPLFTILVFAPKPNMPLEKSQYDSFPFSAW